MKIKGIVEEIDGPEGTFAFVIPNDFSESWSPRGMWIPKEAILDDLRVGMSVIVNISVELDTDRFGNNQNEKN